MADAPILFNNPFPEVQVGAPYEKYSNRVMGTVLVTAGFMEPSGHGFKSYSKRAIFANGSIKTIKPGHHNIGFDYTKGFGSKVICMYSGTVTKAGREGGYGHRIHVKLDIPLIWQGKNHVCYQAYAHNSKLLKRVGDRVSQGEAIAIEAGHGSRGPRDYGSHVDLDTYIYLGQEKVHVNFELLAGGADEGSYIEKIELLTLGAKGIDVRWLHYLLEPSVKTQLSTFTSLSQSSVKVFQAEKGLSSDGIAGEDTCRELGMTGFAIFIKDKTTLKLHPVQSSTLGDFEKKKFDSGEFVFANWIEDKGDHWLFECKEKIKGKFNWYAFKEHVSICEGYPEELTTDELEGDYKGNLDGDDVRWINALKGCPTTGCSSRTNRRNPGVKGSQELARNDARLITKEFLGNCREIGDEYNVPPALILGLASRETHIGSVLGAPSGSKEGWGDRNHAFGVMQVDKRYHKIKGLNDPFSRAHLDQAVGIYASYRDQVKQNHPDWSDENLLKGACSAYNSGVGNVQSISGMDRGTTGDDYGNDVIARSQFFHSYIS